MSHEITDQDLTFSVREQTWHGLSNVLTDYPSREEAKAASLPWEPMTEPLFRRVPVVDDNGVNLEYQEVKESVAVVRDDTGALLGTVSRDYGDALVTNAELFDVAEAIQGGDPAQVRYETGGSLAGGKKVWLLLALNEPLVVPGDPNGATLAYYALQNSHNASGAFRGQATMVRIVCANTSHAADLDAQARGTEFSFMHSKNIKDRIEEAKAALAGWRESVQAWQRINEHLIDIPVTPAQRKLFVDEFVPMPVKGLISDRVVSNIETARQQIMDILASQTCDGIDLTAYGLVQAATEYGQHVRYAQSAETRFKRAYLDRNRLVADAVTLAQEVALA